jgi:hypothetical protein
MGPSGSRGSTGSTVSKGNSPKSTVKETSYESPALAVELWAKPVGLPCSTWRTSACRFGKASTITPRAMANTVRFTQDDRSANYSRRRFQRGAETVGGTRRMPHNKLDALMAHGKVDSTNANSASSRRSCTPRKMTMLRTPKQAMRGERRDAP